MNNKTEEIRIRYLYRDLILRKKIKLPFEAALKIVGPDCAYRLYSVSKFGSAEEPKKKTQKAGRNDTS